VPLVLDSTVGYCCINKLSDKRITFAYNEKEYYQIVQYIKNNPKSKLFQPNDEEINSRLNWYDT